MTRLMQFASIEKLQLLHAKYIHAREQARYFHFEIYYTLLYFPDKNICTKQLYTSIHRFSTSQSILSTNYHIFKKPPDCILKNYTRYYHVDKKGNGRCHIVGLKVTLKVNA